MILVHELCIWLYHMVLALPWDFTGIVVNSWRQGYFLATDDSLHSLAFASGMFLPSCASVKAIKGLASAVVALSSLRLQIKPLTHFNTSNAF